MLKKFYDGVFGELLNGVAGRSRIYAAMCTFALAVLVPGAAFAAGDLETAISPKISDLISEIVGIAVLVVGVVLAVVSAKVVFGLLKKA